MVYRIIIRKIHKIRIVDVGISKRGPNIMELRVDFTYFKTDLLESRLPFLFGKPKVLRYLKELLASPISFI
jgi:hypothetical protein